MVRILVAAVAAGALMMAACGGSSDDSGGAKVSESALLSRAKTDAKHYNAQIAACSWDNRSDFTIKGETVHGTEMTTGAPVDLLNLDGKLGTDWGSGTAGSLGDHVEFATLYSTDKSKPFNADFTKSSGDGWACVKNF